MPDNPPYAIQPGTLTKTLEKIKIAATPERFTQDFMATKLGMRGGTANAMIPLLKKIGFLNTDGTPTDIYRRFRNDSVSGQAAFEALRCGYKTLFEMNERAHDLQDKDLRGLIVQATGLEPNSRVVQGILATFKVLKSFADTDANTEPQPPRQEENNANQIVPSPRQHPEKAKEHNVGMNLSYTINLNLPATADVKVFDAIFRSLREHLLKK